METTNKDFIAMTGRLLGKLGPITHLIDQISKRLLPVTIAHASGGGCYSYCGAYCPHSLAQILFVVEANSEADCNSGNTWVVNMGCQC